MLTLHNIYAISLRNLVANPSGNVLCRRIEWKNIVEVRMVEAVSDNALQVGEIDDHSVLIEFAGLTMNRNQPIVPMELLTLTFV